MGRQIPDSLVLSFLSAEKKTDTGKSTMEITKAASRFWSKCSMQNQLVRLELEGKVERIRHGHMDLWYLKETA